MAAHILCEAIDVERVPRIDLLDTVPRKSGA